ncbi:protein-tyrosine phosphatase-like protein [Xylariales sp. PMI_506]|nr:protein-tyrosine phosphatase-like protein [Xylariales sp. PMI_506]
MMEMDMRHGAVPAAPYESRPPSPPAILIPSPNFLNANEPMKCVPSFANIDPQSLSFRDLEIITQNKPQEAYDSVNNWTYEDRRTAQPVLDFLYLGPSSIARDKKFLQENGITMLLAARDARMAQARLMGVDRVAKDLGIYAEYIDVSDRQELIRTFPHAVRAINNHMLEVYRSQAVSVEPQGAQGLGDDSMVIDRGNFKRGRVLVFCETGNDRSAAIIVAYLMSVFGMNMVQACQFTQFRRFCVSLDEDMKFLLQTFEGILSAQKTVHRHEFLNPVSIPSATDGSRSGTLSSTSTAITPSTPNTIFSTQTDPKTRLKRGIEDTIDNDEMLDVDDFAYDRDRYTERPAFVPFVDQQNNL